MPTIELADGSKRTYSDSITVAEIARDISPSLAKKAIAATIDGKNYDLDHLISKDVKLNIITTQQPEALEIIRHSTAHLLAQAVKRLYPDAQITIGPVIENGFYYDFALANPLTTADLENIEKTMHEIIREKLPVSRKTMSHQAAIEHFTKQGELYKAEIIRDIPTTEQLTLYKQGEFEDLCRGPHVPNTSFLGVFKLTKVAGAYWRGNSSNAMLQRVYGTAWAEKKDLDDYLFQIEEAEKRDHRKIGKQLGLFHFQDIAPGMVFWHHLGWQLYQTIQEYIRDKLKNFNYQEIRTPQLVDKILWEKSGHWANFRENMFITETENRQYAVKPMNCPCHVQVYNQGIKSYRDLPLRLAEFGNCHRCEPSGSLHGLMRVRNFVQDDAHIFCTQEQLQAEVSSLLSLVQEVYQDFGFKNIIYRLALRPEKRVGSEQNWDRAEQSLRDAMLEHGIQWQDAPGEGAFYGPKIECSLTDSLNRIWQCGTIQIDFSMPERLDAEYIAEDNSRQIPIMIHRAIIGTFERFIGILLENCAGILPTWLAPEQICIMSLSDQQHDYSRQIHQNLIKNDLRCKIDLRNEKIGFKIREHTLQKIPYLLVIGKNEMANGTVALRKRDGTDLGEMALDAAIQIIKTDIAHKGNYNK